MAGKKNLPAKIITIVGPTASGKSQLALEIAQKFDGEIICADSRTIYKYFDIGTAKPTLEERKAVHHYGLDLIEPGQSYSAYDFKKYCGQTISEIQKRGCLPILVGGAGLYIDAVLFDYKFRKSITEEKYEDLNYRDLIERAKAMYPEEIKQIDTNNRRRIEQLLQRGPSQKADRTKLKIDTLIIGLNPNRVLLKQKITTRLDLMLSNGFIQEVSRLIERYDTDCPQLDMIGYLQIKDYIGGKLNLDKAKSLIIAGQMNLARRQITWFKRNPHIHWFENTDQAIKFITQSLDAKVQ